MFFYYCTYIRSVPPGLVIQTLSPLSESKNNNNYKVQYNFVDNFLNNKC